MLSFLNKRAPQRGRDPEGDRHIFLIGFMGCGKTTVGALLARLLGRGFLDLDRLLEAEYGKGIPEVFHDPALGEADFRRREAARIKGILDCGASPKVVALGGGAVTDPATQAALKAKGLVFYLSADDPRVLWERVRAEAGEAGPQGLRPNARSPEAFERLFKERLPLYRAMGRPVDATLPPEALAGLIARRLVSREATLTAQRSEISTLRTYLCLGDVLEALASRTKGHRVLLLLDHALPFEEQSFRGALGDRLVCHRTRGRGEAAKTIPELEGILSALSGGSFDRSDFLVVRGGGSLSDLGALAAGLFKRGIRLILLPTTLLAAVDAAIGGKAAVNFADAKNQVGLFYLPSDVWLDGGILGSLNHALLSEGLTEAYKMGLIMDSRLFSLVTANIGQLLSFPRPPLPDRPGPDGGADGAVNDVALLSDIAFRSASLKMEVVESDYHEELGLRDKLNFGHTWGHVVESAHAGSSDPVSHGRAVAHGMAVSLLHSERELGLDKAFAATARSVCLTLAGGEFPENPGDSLALGLLAKDKKIRGGALRFVALREPHVTELVEITPERLAGTARELSLQAAQGILRPYS